MQPPDNNDHHVINKLIIAMKNSVLKYLTIFSFLLFYSNIYAQDWENTLNVNGINKIKIVGNINLNIIQSDKEVLSIRAKGFEENEVIYRVSDSTLIFYTKNSKGLLGTVFRGEAKVDAKLHLKSLKSLIASDNVNIYNKDKLSTNEILITSSKSQINLNLNTNNINIKSSDKSSMRIEGKTDSINISCSDNGTVNCANLLAIDCRVKISDGSNVKVQASKTLNLFAADGSEIIYSGKASVINKEAKGGSRIIRTEK